MRVLTLVFLLCLAAAPPANAGPLATAIAGILVAVGVPAGAASLVGWGVVTPAVVSREKLK